MPSQSDFSKLLPMNDFVHIKPDVVDPKTDGGLHIPKTVLDREQIKTMTGQLLAVGPRADLIFYKDGNKVGKQVENSDLPLRVIFAEYGGHAVYKPVYDEGGEKRRETDYYRVMRSCDVTCVME